MSQNYAWKGSIQVQDRPMDFNVTQCEKFIVGVSNCLLLQPTFKKLSLVNFWCSITEECPLLNEKT